MKPDKNQNFLQTYAKNFAAERWIAMFKNGRISKLAEEFCISFQHFAEYSYATLADDKYETLNHLIGQFLFIMSNPGYQIPLKYVPKLVELGPIIANTVAMSKFQNTDSALAEIIDHPDNFYKILILYSARNLCQINPEALFRINHELASQWYWSYFVCPGSYPGKAVYENMRRHIAYIDPRLELTDATVLLAYFNSTYIDSEGHRKLKSRINSLMQSAVSGIPIKNSPDGTIAVCTSKWYPRSAVYRCLAKSVKAMAKRHRLELIHFGDPIPDLDTSDFSDTKVVTLKNLQLDIRAIANNRYSAVFFPDIGMNLESVMLSNMRIAPVQFMGYGHPVSTFGAKIDYMIGGEDIEPDDADQYYSEKLLRLPGNGQPTIRSSHLNPEDAKANRVKHVRSDRVVVNCPWSQDKTTWPLVDCLRKIKSRCKANVLFRLFPNEAINRVNYFIPYVQGVMETIGELDRVEIHQAFGQEYMDRVAAGDLTLDSWPFNGYNTVIDSLQLGIPVITLKGRQCFERVGAELLNRVGISDLIALSEDEYIEKAVMLIDSPEARGRYAGLINFDTLSFDAENGEAFADAVDSIL